MFRYLQMPMGLTQAPAHFYYAIEDVLRGWKGVDKTLPVVVYYENIALSGNFQQYVLADTIETIKRLVAMGL